MAVRDDRSDVKQTTAGFRGPLMVQSLTSAKSKFLSLGVGIPLTGLVMHYFLLRIRSGVPPVRLRYHSIVALLFLKDA